ncbi:hypothetical protein J6590_072591, partial [Homalodisca vitripennis]
MTAFEARKLPFTVSTSTSIINRPKSTCIGAYPLKRQHGGLPQLLGNLEWELSTPGL